MIHSQGDYFTMILALRIGIFNRVKSHVFPTLNGLSLFINYTSLVVTSL